MSRGERSRPEFPYRKLPGDFRGFFRRNMLWLGPDHLLQVDSSRFSETYKRFYLRDIQTIIVRKTPRFVLPYYWIVLALAAFGFLLAGVAPFRPVRFWPASVVLGGTVLYLYAASMFQSCRCHLTTRVSKVELSSLFRLRAARQFADLITPRIIEAQGQMPEGWVEGTTSLTDLSTAADRSPEDFVEVLSPGAFSWLTVVVFVFVLLDAGLTWLQLRSPGSKSLAAPNVANLIALAVCATAAIVRLSRGKNRNRGGWALRGLVLAGLFATFAVTYGAVLLQSFDQQFYHQNFANVLDYTGMRSLGVGEIVLDCMVAIPGLILAFSQAHASREPSSLFHSGAPPA